jgi:acetyl esterase/lipase
MIVPLIEFVLSIQFELKELVFLRYRKSPDHPFPIPVDDCWSIVQHLMKNPTELNLDPSRMVLSGDSAGGNVALVLTQRLIRQKMTLPKLQVRFKFIHKRFYGSS